MHIRTVRHWHTTDCRPINTTNGSIVITTVGLMRISPVCAFCAYMSVPCGGMRGRPQRTAQSPMWCEKYLVRYVGYDSKARRNMLKEGVYCCVANATHVDCLTCFMLCMRLPVV